MPSTAKNATQLSNHQIWKACRLAIFVLYSFLSASVLAHYLQWQPEPLIRIILFGLLILACRYLAKVSLHRMGLSKHICFGVFSVLLSLSIILGYHIVITDGYSGTISENYITAYSLFDLVAFVVVSINIYLYAISLFCKMSGLSKNETIERTVLRFTPLKPKWVLGLALITFITWLPYLLIYWPGFIFGDSVVSLNQITGAIPWSNHHPAAYTFLIKLCVDITTGLGLDLTAGCALYSIIQMTCMALCFSYLVRWVVVRLNLNTSWNFILVAFFAFTPYIATYSIAMWKDPLFSAAIVVVTLQLADLILSKGEIAVKQRSFTILFTIALLLMMLLRSNGVFISILLALAFIAVLVCTRKRLEAKGFQITLCATLLSIVFALVLTGPIYSLIGIIPTPQAESVGIPLNQMARVAALSQDMSESDIEYMSSILPIEEYPEKYRPSCTDLLK